MGHGLAEMKTARQKIAERLVKQAKAEIRLARQIMARMHRRRRTAAKNDLWWGLLN